MSLAFFYLIKGGFLQARSVCHLVHAFRINEV